MLMQLTGRVWAQNSPKASFTGPVEPPILGVKLAWDSRKYGIRPDTNSEKITYKLFSRIQLTSNTGKIRILA